MTDEARQRIDAALDAVLDLPPEGRADWLLAHHPDDPALREEVLQLLGAMERDGILETQPAEELTRRPIGPYRVLRELGRGGMGVVYLAERDDGQYRRRVAIKILRASPDAEELHRRFIAERQILASLDHPNIALLLDGGITEGQLPYLVMEYVEGMPITTWCDRHRLGVRGRLRLFLDVCAAVSHAHHNLVVHRDLKPSNILVDTDGRVKLLDFGIAKLLNPGLSGVDQPMTRTEFRMMTPEYASPEQVLGEPLSTASDVYSLGVILYELLVGQRPYRLDTVGPAELATIVCEREPERPSSRLVGSEATPAHADARGVSSERLRRQLRGDLDAIVMMALRKESRTRYPSAGGLAQDLTNYLDGAPVLAHRGGRAYRARRFITRHRGSVVTALLIGCSLLGGTLAALWQAGTARQERDRARGALESSEEITRFLMALFEDADPEERLGDTVTARDLLARGGQRVDELVGQPMVQARLFEVMGRVHSSMEESDQARMMMARSLELRRALLGEDHPEVATGYFHYADILRNARDYLAADSIARRALAIRRTVLGAQDTSVATSLLQLSALAIYRTDPEDAERLAREAVDILQSAVPVGDRRLPVAMQQLASVVRRRGRSAEAETLLRQAIALLMPYRSRYDQAATFALLRLAELLAVDREDRAAAEVVTRQAVEVAREDLGPDHPQLAWGLSDLAVLIAQGGAFEEGLALAREAAAMMARIYGPTHRSAIRIVSAKARVHLLAGRPEVAESLWRSEAEYFAAIDTTDATIAGLGGIALALEAQGRYPEADSLRRQLVDFRRNTSGPHHLLTAIETGHLAWLRHLQGDNAEAERLFLGAISDLEVHTAPGHHDVRRLHRQLAEVYAATGRDAEAEHHRELSRPG